MKTIKIFLAVFTGLLLFVSCQKEFSLETGNTAGGAVGTLQDTLGNCQPITINGIYQTNTPLAEENYVLVQVNITSPGIYIIKSDVKNGMSFADSAYIGTTGAQTVKLKGTGTPITATPTEFTVTFGTSFCLFSITPTAGTGGGGTTAAYALAGACASSISVQGTYTTGTALTTSNTVTLQVNVTTIGNYTINTGAQNGMTFSRTGTFTTTGPQTVVLQGSGTPATAGNTTVNVTAGTSTCTFTVPVAQGSGGGGVTNPNDADSAWSFTQGNFYHGPFDFVYDTTTTQSGYTVNFEGSTSASGDTILFMAVRMPGTTIVPGTYNTNAATAAFYFMDFRGTNPVMIDSSDIRTTGTNVAITISSYNATTRLLNGTFSGTAKSRSGALVNITGGRFAAKLD